MIPATPPNDIRVENIPAMTIHADYSQLSGFWLDHNTALPPEPKHKSSFWKRELHYNQLIEAARSTKAYEAGWDGYDAPVPNDEVIDKGVALLKRMKSTELNPYSVLPSADGGIGISFRGRQGRRAVLEILNDGTSTYVIYGKGHPTLTDVFDATSQNLTPFFTLITENL